ncbi:MAG: metallophosphoesterase [Planctomycetes bacterium]|nr:metallophosphoesterase [Planctomycetota bacterium]
MTASAAPVQSPERRDPRLPVYHGAEHLRALLPKTFEAWPLDPEALMIGRGFHRDEARAEELRAYCEDKPFVWPSRRIVFLTDLHADAEAFVDSLVASGTVARTGPGPLEFELCAEAEGVLFVFGGDYFDKGPSNFTLLRSIKRFLDLGVESVMLAGNHDVRALVGMFSAGAQSTDLAHLFVRMGNKAVPLFSELVREFGIEHQPLGARGEDAAHEKLFPPPSWFEDYPRVAEGIVPPDKIEQELVRMRQKCHLMLDSCHAAGISLAMLDDVVEAFRKAFVEEGGEFSWFFPRLQVAHREGSLLFVHAGLDDGAAELLAERGVDGLNQTYRDMVARRDLFRLYHGSIGNCFRTKYRTTDLPFSERGAQRVRDTGAYVIVHGHRNLVAGQRLMFRRGILNVECDCGVDRNTRIIEGLGGHGAAATLFHPDGSIVGVSSDRPGAKLIDFTDYCKLLTVI